MRKLFRGITSIILVIEIIGAVLSALVFVLEKIGVMKKMHKTQNPPIKKN